MNPLIQHAGFFEYIKDAILFVLDFIQTALASLVSPVLQTIGALIPDSIHGYIQDAIPYVLPICNWIPLAEAVTFTLAYYEIKVTLTALNWTFKILRG